MTDIEIKRSGAIFERPLPRWKRVMDIAGASVLIVLAAPVMLATALFIKIVSPGKALFTQDRIGHGGKSFTIFKFRTMRAGADVSSHREYMTGLIRGAEAAEKKPMLKQDRANPAIIPFGSALRKSAVDELPQLFNVFRGDMSLVGPRPVLPYEAQQFLEWHKGRFDVLPGLTGLWQVSGKNNLTFSEMIRLDVRYSREMSPAMDIGILARTPGVLLMELLPRRTAAKPPTEDQ